MCQQADSFEKYVKSSESFGVEATITFAASRVVPSNSCACETKSTSRPREAPKLQHNLEWMIELLAILLPNTRIEATASKT